MTNKTTDEKQREANCKVIIYALRSLAVGLMAYGLIEATSNRITEIRPAEINGTNGYQTVNTNGRTNYYVSTSGFNVKKINPSEKLETPRYSIRSVTGGLETKWQMKHKLNKKK